MVLLKHMYTADEYANLTTKYGAYSSWALWDYQNQSDPEIISRYINQLHSKFVLFGLNISRPLSNQPWSNFHTGPNNVRKLKYACNDTELRGSYITDVFKGIPERQSKNFKKLLTDKIIFDNVNFFNQEMTDIGLSSSSKFIVFGAQNSLLAQCFNKYFKQGYKNKVIYHYHYSYYGLSDKEWVLELWRKLGIDQNFEFTINKYSQR